MMNGTSMSCPNVTGVIACLLSALKDARTSPFLTRLILENTAILPKNDCNSDAKLSYGHGLFVFVCFNKSENQLVHSNGQLVIYNSS